MSASLGGNRRQGGRTWQLARRSLAESYGKLANVCNGSKAAVSRRTASGQKQTFFTRATNEAHSKRGWGLRPVRCFLDSDDVRCGGFAAPPIDDLTPWGITLEARLSIAEGSAFSLIPANAPVRKATAPDASNYDAEKEPTSMSAIRLLNTKPSRIVSEPAKISLKAGSARSSSRATRLRKPLSASAICSTHVSLTAAK